MKDTDKLNWNECQPFANKLDATKQIKYVLYLYMCVIYLFSWLKIHTQSVEGTFWDRSENAMTPQTQCHDYFTIYTVK